MGLIFGAVGSVGRALHLQCRGHQFDSGTVHQNTLLKTLPGKKHLPAKALS